MQVYFYTLGCKSNQYETRQIAEKFLALGYQTAGDFKTAAIIVVNTCSVTHIAERKARNIIRKFMTNNPRAKVYVCGCYVNIADFPKITPGVIPVKQEQKLKPETWGLPSSRAARPCGSTGRQSPILRRPVREFLKIQEGCACFCSYCIIPYARPRLSSEPPEKILAAAEKLIQNNAQEIILTGINLGRYAYTPDAGTHPAAALHLADILRLLLQTSIPRIRLSSLEPDTLTPELLEIIAANPRIARHLHIPLQSGSDKILQAMRRKYSAAQFAEIIAGARQTLGDAIGLTTDIIVGFPGENARTFQETFEFVQKLNFSDMHIFPYSRRAQTAAASLAETCPENSVKQFVSQLNTLRQAMRRDFLQKHLSSTLEVLIENDKGEGFSSEYIQVKLPGKPERGKFYAAAPAQIYNDCILAKITGII